VWIGLPRENVMPGRLEAMVLESGTTDDRYRPTRRDAVTALAARGTFDESHPSNGTHPRTTRGTHLHGTNSRNIAPRKHTWSL